MKTIGLTALFCLAATPAFAQYAQPTYPEASPSPAPSTWQQPTAPSYAYPQASPAAAPSTWQQPAASPSFSSNTESRKPKRHNGFHISLGGGFAGGGEENRPGFATQFKIGLRVDADWVIYYYALNDWYRTNPSGAYWRIAAINGVGVDYFVVPQLGIRVAVGAGANGPFDVRDTDRHKAHYGYSYAMGLTWHIGNEENHFSIDPVIHMLQTKGGYTWSDKNWRTDPYFLLTANWVMN